MNTLIHRFAFAACLGASLTACASSPHYAGSGGHDYDRGRQVSRCDNCGTVENIEEVWTEEKQLGGGTVLGAIIGGVVGNQVGKGNGRRAATAAGAVIGGAVGHEAEKRQRPKHPAYRFDIRLDSGRYKQVTQWDNPGLRRGDRVVIQGKQVMPLR